MSDLAGTPGAIPLPRTDPLAAELSRVWPDDGRSVRKPVLVLSLVAGLVAAVLVVDTPPGLGVLLSGLAVGATVLPAARHRLGPHEIGRASCRERV